MEQASKGVIEQRLTDKLERALSPVVLTVLNESYMHNVPPGSESHFKVVAVSAEFEGTRRVRRHRLIHKILEEELSDHIHALSIDALTPQEWEERKGRTNPSPVCLGGSKSEGT
jgi:BolA protein